MSTGTMSERAAQLAAALIRNVDDVSQRRLHREPHYDGKIARLSEGTAARKLGASLYELAPGMRVCPYHLHHAQEEMYFILDGNGTLRVSGEMLPVRAGDAIFVPPGPDYPHQLINTSHAPLKYLCMSTMEDPEICQYPDSGKYMAEGSLNSGTLFEITSRLASSLDYWDGEP